MIPVTRTAADTGEASENKSDNGVKLARRHHLAQPQHTGGCFSFRQDSKDEILSVVDLSTLPPSTSQDS